MLLHKSNKWPAIPLYYATDEKEDRVTLEKLLDIIKYKEHNWKLCCDLKVVKIIAVMKVGNPNHGCFKCDWNRNDKDKDQYTDKWTGTNPDIKTDIKINMNIVLIPPLHLKLGIVQKFLNLVLKQNDETYRFFKEGMFKRRTDTRIKSGIYKLSIFLIYHNLMKVRFFNLFTSFESISLSLQSKFNFKFKIRFSLVTNNFIIYSF